MQQQFTYHLTFILMLLLFNASAYAGITVLKPHTYSPEELRQILEAHTQWLNQNPGLSDEKKIEAWLGDPRRADMSGAILIEANLKGVDLSDANLEGANLSGANLIKAKLMGADLSDTNLKGADLSGANLTDVNLSGANLRETDFSGANLSGGDLSGANHYLTNLSNTNLSRVNLSDAIYLDVNLSDAKFWHADFSDVIFEPSAGTLPPVLAFWKASGFASMNYFDSPHGLLELRNKFSSAGAKQQEKEVTYAIKHSELQKIFNPKVFDDSNPLLSQKLDAYFKWVFFELTTQWGMSPSRALIILLLLIPLFALPYVVAFCVNGKDGIWQEWIHSRVRQDLGQEKPIRLRISKPSNKHKGMTITEGYSIYHSNLQSSNHIGWSKAINYALYFSVLSAFHVGWRDLNVGTWISRIQPREYTLRASGWVRSISGIQSLISVYLVAIWALTYFGRPFG